MIPSLRNAVVTAAGTLPSGDPARWLDPEEIAKALVFLARQDSRAWSHEIWLRPALDTWM